MYRNSSSVEICFKRKEGAIAARSIKLEVTGPGIKQKEMEKLDQTH